MGSKDPAPFGSSIEAAIVLIKIKGKARIAIESSALALSIGGKVLGKAFDATV